MTPAADSTREPVKIEDETEAEVAREVTLDLEARKHRHKITFRILWVCWVVAGLVLEGVAIAMRFPGDTLSENVWELLDAMRAAPGGAFLVAGFSMLLIGFFGWVTLHFVQRLMARKAL